MIWLWLYYTIAESAPNAMQIQTTGWHRWQSMQSWHFQWPPGARVACTFMRKAQIKFNHGVWYLCSYLLCLSLLHFSLGAVSSKRVKRAGKALDWEAVSKRLSFPRSITEKLETAPKGKLSSWPMRNVFRRLRGLPLPNSIDSLAWVERSVRDFHASEIVQAQQPPTPPPGIA